MNTNQTRSWNLDGMRVLLARSLHTWQAVDARPALPQRPPSGPVPRPHPMCDELACGECMQAG
jgi:hypothetical protein